MPLANVNANDHLRIVVDVLLGRFGSTNCLYLMTMEIGPTPKASINLSVTVLSASSISLDWEDNLNDKTHFRIDHNAGGGLFSEIAMAKADMASFTYDNLQAGIMSTYRDRVENSAWSSSYSNTVIATTKKGLFKFFIKLQGNRLPEDNKALVNKKSV